MFRKLSVLGFISLAVPAGAALYALGSLGSYTRYIADDYCSAAIAQNMSLIDAVKYWYTNWHGGFSATLMDELMPLLGKHGIAWTPPLTILIWWLFAVWATSNL